MKQRIHPQHTPGHGSRQVICPTDGRPLPGRPSPGRNQHHAHSPDRQGRRRPERGSWRRAVVGSCRKCLDTAPATAGDAEFPYVGHRVAELPLAQVKTLDRGFMQLPRYAGQDVIGGNRVAELKDVYRLARDYDAKKVRFNVETTVGDGKPGGEGMVALTKPVAAQG